MEFTHVGKHCAQADCRQQDFLPFTCDTCKQSYCLSHRSYFAHQCIGANKKDMTSIDCPICHKSVKFDKSQNVDEVWDLHYTKECTRVAANPKTSQKCHKAGCNTVLGPSNTFICPKCNRNVCLSHRMTDDHNCTGAAIRDNKSFFLGMFDSTNNNQSNTNNSNSKTRNASGSNKVPSKPPASCSSVSSKAKSKPEVIDLTNTVKGTAAQRMKPAVTTTNTTTTPSDWSDVSHFEYHLYLSFIFLMNDVCSRFALCVICSSLIQCN